MLDYRLVLPRLAPGQRAPVLVTVYGGPQAHDVQNGFVSPLEQYLVQQGWALFQVDNRGQEGRGTAFQKPGYRALGGVEVADQLAGLAWLKQQPVVDPAKVAVYGHSYGGYMVAQAARGRARVPMPPGVAGAPVTRWDLYDTHYTEHYMGDPQQASRRLRQVRRAPRQRQDQGSAAAVSTACRDDNVLFQNSTELMARMQEEKVPFEAMVYPGKAHGITGTNISVHLWTTILEFPRAARDRLGRSSTSAASTLTR